MCLAEQYKQINLVERGQVLNINKIRWKLPIALILYIRQMFETSNSQTVAYCIYHMLVERQLDVICLLGGKTTARLKHHGILLYSTRENCPHPNQLKL